MLRVVLAFLIAPLPAAFIQSAVVALWPKNGMGVFQHPLSMFFAICLLFYAFGLILGIPLLLLAGKRNVRSLGGYALGGLTTILLPIALALGVTILRGTATAYLLGYALTYFAVGGALAGATFWLVARPDRSRPYRPRGR
jgi:hypothetical protein